MKFSILHLLLFTTAIGFAFAMRAWASFYEQEGYVGFSAIGVSILIAGGICWLGAGYRKSVFLGAAAAAVVLASHFIECLFATESTAYVWSKPSFISDPGFYVSMTLLFSFGCYATALGSAFLAFWFSGRLQAEQRG